MDIYNFMNQKMFAKINGEETGMTFPGINHVSEYWRKFGLHNSTADNSYNQGYMDALKENEEYK